MIAPDVGGGFGSKVEVYADDMIVITCAKRLGRSVKWVEERSEACVATVHGRDHIQEIELAATRTGKITGVRVRLTASMGAYLQAVTPGIPLLGAWLYAGVLRHRGIRLSLHGRLHEHDPDRRVPRGRPPRGDVRDRAHDGHARAPRSARSPSRSAG